MTSRAVRETARVTSEVTFDLSLRRQLRSNLDRHQVREHSDEGLARAAVCVVVLDSDALIHGVDPLASGESTSDRKRLLAEIPGSTNDVELTGSVEGTDK